MAKTDNTSSPDPRLARLETIARLNEEKRSMEYMVTDYCKHKHADREKNAADLCEECAEFLDYSLMRLARCPFGEKKPVCAKCNIHCYKPNYREQACAIMRFAGPRLTWQHPILAFRHMWFSFTVKPPEKNRNKKRAQPASTKPVATEEKKPEK